MDAPVRICIVGEWLHGRPDEGIHNLALNLFDQWAKDHSVGRIKVGADLAVNRLFLSTKLRKALRNMKPQIVFYISPSGAKTAALLRARMLKAYASQARVWVVASQPAVNSGLANSLLPLLAPDGVLVQSPQGNASLKALPCPIHFLPSGVDLERFVPVEAGQKIALRKQYGVDDEALVILHVGHIQQGRNVQLLSNIARSGEAQVWMAGSTSTVPDETLMRRLTSMGVHVVREFIPNVAELYQLADVYLFPVRSEHAAIGVPLSVLEAMACNLPIITTRFGGLSTMFREGDGLFYFDEETELPQLLRDARILSPCLTRQMVEPYSWQNVARSVLEMVCREEAAP